MTNSEAKELFTTLFHEWSQSLSPAERDCPSFTAFKAWLIKKNYARYLHFESAASPEVDVRRWFNKRYRIRPG
jgi:hypothetical protein